MSELTVIDLREIQKKINALEKTYHDSKQFTNFEILRNEIYKFLMKSS